VTLDPKSKVKPGFSKKGVDNPIDLADIGKKRRTTALMGTKE